LLTVGLLLPLLAMAEAGPEIPDVRANIMQMLEQGRQDGRSSVILDEHGQPPGQGTPGKDSSAIGQETVREPVRPEKVPPPIVPQRENRSQPGRASSPGEAHLRLPEKEITISGPEDLERLQQTFEQARDRQQER
jgi:hypothetical protein